MKTTTTFVAADLSQITERYDADAVTALKANCSTRIILGKPNPDQAAQIAKLIGKTPAAS